MAGYGLIKGHLWIQSPNGHYWADNGKLIKDETRTCPRCQKSLTSDKYDKCLGELPGVEAACCGHGEEEGYIKFSNGVIIRGFFEVDREGLEE